MPQEGTLPDFHGIFDLLGAATRKEYKMKSLYEQYRPSAWEQLVGQDNLAKRLTILRRRGLVGRVFWVIEPNE